MGLLSPQNYLQPDEETVSCFSLCCLSLLFESNTHQEKLKCVHLSLASPAVKTLLCFTFTSTFYVLVFYNEVLESIRHGVEDQVDPENLILEINASK